MASFSPRVLVTGGGFGLGYATVKFLLNKYNARVLVFTLDYGEELEDLLQKYAETERLFVVKGDVTNVSPYYILLKEAKLMHVQTTGRRH
jgi:NAD(P)-dependent dehydrogenase (short-subunit alcohol dehydrogenase family)